MDNVGKIVVIFSLLGVCILYGTSLSITPPLVPLDDVAPYEGSVIRTRGVITDFSTLRSGHVLMTIEGNQMELPIFVPSEAKNEKLLNLSYGDEIEVEGRVNVYRGKYQLVVSGNAIKKVTSGGNIYFVSQIAERPAEYEGRKLQVVGYVDRVYKRIFYLSDERGDYRLRVKLMAGDIPISKLQKGDKIIAEGVFSYDAQNMRYELNLVALRRCD